MSKSIFAVCDLEASYARSLMEYLNEKKSTPFEVQAFTCLESLSQFASEREIEILLISSRLMCDEIRELKVNRIIILSEGDRISEEQEEFPSIYKYQSCDDILAEVMEYYVTDHPASPYVHTGKVKTRIYGVYSPVGRCRKTSFALTLGEVLAEKKEVLYINLEEYSGFEELFNTKYKLDISDLIYFSRQNDGGLIYKLNSVIQNLREMQYIPPALSPVDLRDVSGREWTDLLQEITACCEYEVIILELSSQVEDMFSLLQMCDRIYLPTLDDPFSQAKLNQYERLVNMLGLGDILEKTQKVKPPRQVLQTGQSQMIQQLLWGEMGNYVRQLLWEEE